MRVWVAIAVGGALGALSRWFVGTLLGSLDAAGSGFPWGTLTANVVGCALIGFLAPLLAKQAAWLVGFTITGFLGGFTTYSAFAEETFILLDRGDATGVMLAGVYVLMHAHLVAIIQVLVYAGGVTVLFGFVIMLLKQGEPMRHRGPFMPIWIVSLFTVGYLAYLVLPVLRTVEMIKEKLPPDYGTIEFVGRVLLSEHLVPFEVVAILLLMTLVGVVALARRPQERKEVA